MKRLILAAAFSAAALCAFPERSFAAKITFTGLVDEVDARFNPAHLMVGDTFSGTFFFNSRPDPFGDVGGPVSKYSITIGEFMFKGTPAGGHEERALVALVPDPKAGSVLYQVAFLVAPNPSPYASAEIGVTLQAGTPTGVIPPLDQFNLNDFNISLTLPIEPDVRDSVFGHLTSFPTFNLAVPDGGTSMMLLSCGLIVLAVLRYYLRADSKA
jgi:hypothetical protein